MKRLFSLLIPILVATLAMAALFHALMIEESAWAASAPAAAPEAVLRSAPDQTISRHRVEMGSALPVVQGRPQADAPVGMFYTGPYRLTVTRHYGDGDGRGYVPIKVAGQWAGGAFRVISVGPGPSQIGFKHCNDVPGCSGNTAWGSGSIFYPSVGTLYCENSNGPYNLNATCGALFPGYTERAGAVGDWNSSSPVGSYENGGVTIVCSAPPDTCPFHADDTVVIDLYPIWYGTLPVLSERQMRSGLTPKNGQGDGRESATTTTACPCAQGQAGDPINTHTGGFDFSWTDLSLPTAAGPLVFQRSYASLITNTTLYTTTLGPGWTHNQDTRLIFPSDSGGEANTLLFKAHSANEYRFYIITDSGGITTYVPYLGVLASLTYTTTPTAVYTLTNSAQTTYVFTSTGKLMTWADAQNHEFNYSYDGSGRLITVTESASGRYLAFTYNGSGQLTQASDHAGRHVDYGYDLTTGDLLTVTDVLGQNWTYVYTGTTHLLTGAKDPRGVTLVHTDYDSQGRAWKQTDGLNQTTAQIQYNVNNTTVITDARGFTATHTYNDHYTLTGETQPLASAVTKTYDSNFRQREVTDPLNHTTNFVWSNTGTNLTQIMDALNNTTRFSYDTLNNLTQTVDARGYTTTLSYTGTLLSVLTDTLGNRMLYTYTTASDSPQPVGLLKAMTDAKGNTTQYKYDSLGQRTVMTDALGVVSNYAYDTLGRLITTTVSVGTPQEQTSVNQYDNAGRLTQVTRNYLAGQAQNYQNLYNLIMQYAYDSVGNQTVMTDTLGRATRTDYDNLNRPITVTVNYINGLFDSTKPDEDIASTTQYDSNGNVITTTQYVSIAGLERKTFTEYDALNRPVTVTTNYVNGSFDSTKPDEDIQTVTGYDLAGNVVTTTQLPGVSGLERKTLTEYDALNRPVTVTTNYVNGVFTTARPDEDISTVTAYDVNGNVVTTTQYAGISGLERKTFTQYDALNRPITVTTNYVNGSFDPLKPDEDIRSVTEYDSNGNVITTTQYVGISGLERKTFTQYDALNRPITVTTNYVNGSFDAAKPDEDIPTVTQYDVNGNVITTTQYAGIAGLGRKTYTQYDLLNRPITVTTNYVDGTFSVSEPDKDIQTLTQYDALGKVITTTQFANVTNLSRKTFTQYDALNRPITMTTNYVNSSFDSAKPDEDIVQATVYNGAGDRVNTIEYRGGPGLTTTAITTTYAYDKLSRVITTTLPLTGTDVATLVATYDGLGRVTDRKDPLGHTARTNYDLLGRPITVTVNYVNGVFDPAITDEDLQTVNGYDAAGNLLTVRDPKSITTTYGYDLLNRLITVTDALTGTTRYTYTAASNVITLTDALTHTTTFGYDLLDRVITTTDPLTHTTVYTYDAVNRTQMKDALNAVTVYTYNLRNELTNIDYPSGTADVTNTYDGAGQRTQMTDGLGTTTWSYDLASRPITVTDPFTGTMIYTYDSAGDRVNLKYPDGKVVTYTYDLANRLVQASDWSSLLTKYAYDSASRLTTLSLPNGITSTYGYDNADHLLMLAHQTITQTLGVYTYTVDAAGNRTQAEEYLRSPGALTSTLTAYWKLDEENGTRNDSAGGNHLTDNNTVTQAAGKLNKAAQFTAANSEYLSRADNADLSLGDIDFTLAAWVYFDNLGATRTLIAKWGPVVCEYLLEYTPAEGLAFRASSGGSCLTGVSSAVYTGTLNTGQWYLVTAWHDSAANTLNLQVNDGSAVSASHAGGVFDGLNEFRLGARADVVSPNYMDGRLDGAGVWKRVLTATERNALWNSSLGCEYHFCAATITYTYDSLYRLTNATYSTGSVFTYTYDAVGNRLTETTITATTVYTYDNANRLTNVGPITYTWDANGNLLTDGVYTNTYDAANRLITTTTGAITNTFAYNGDGARLKQLVNGTPTMYTVDLAAGLTQVLVDVTSGVTNTYLYGNGRIAQDNSGNGTSYFLGDALGSVRQLANSNAAVILTKNYQPYGSVLSTSGSGTSSYGFTGEWTDNTGLVYLRARYYTPGVGRFVSKDMWMGDYNQPMSFNPWLYTYANSINLTDPTGHNPCDQSQNKELCYRLLRAVLAGLVGQVQTYQAAKNIKYNLGSASYGVLYEFLNNETLGWTATLDPAAAMRTDMAFNLGRMAGRGASLGLSAIGLVGGGGCTGFGLASAPSGLGLAVAGGGIALTAHSAAALQRGLTEPLPNIYFASSEGGGNSGSATSGIPSKRERLSEFMKRLKKLSPASSYQEAKVQVENTLNQVEDEMTNIPYNLKNSAFDGRMYPVQSDNIHSVPNSPNVTRLRSRFHNTFIGKNGSIEIQSTVGDKEVIFSKPGADGKGVWD